MCSFFLFAVRYINERSRNSLLVLIIIIRKNEKKIEMKMIENLNVKHEMVNPEKKSHILLMDKEWEGGEERNEMK